jgi:hypothetical protein
MQTRIEQTRIEQTRIDQISDRIYRISTSIPDIAPGVYEQRFGCGA